MSPNSRLPSNSRTSDWVRLAICLALLSVAAILTFIVFHDLLREASDSGLERRKEVAADDVQRLQVPGIGRLDYQRLFEALSEPGESLDAFVLRISPCLRAYSDETGFEACGVIAQGSGDRFGVVVGTSRAHSFCPNFSAKVPENMAPNGQTLHSHPRANTYRINATDRAFLGPLFRVGEAYTRGSKGVFSADDFASGPGYLVSPNGTLYHQDGPKAVRKVTE